MKLSIYKADYSKTEERKKQAQYLARLINGDDFTPCPKIGEEETCWGFTLDMGNNWWLWFDKEDSSAFTISYCYNHGVNKAEEKLFGWLSFKYSDRIIRLSD